MPNVIEGAPSLPSGARFAVVASRFNEFVTKALAEGAVAALVEAGAADGDVDLVWVPGAWEIPLAARRLAGCGRYAAVVCVGAVIRGETPHFEHVAAQAARGVADAARDTNVPVTFGVLTANTVEQARERAGGAAGNRGADAARAALRMVNLLRDLPGGP